MVELPTDGEKDCPHRDFTDIRNPTWVVADYEKPKRGKIPEELHEDLLKLYCVEKKTLAEVAKWLSAEHQISVTPMALSKLFRNIVAERGEQVRSVVQTRLIGSVTSDLEHLDSMLFAVREEGEEARAKDKGLFLRCVEQARKIIETKLKFSGVEKSTHTETLEVGFE